MGVEVFTVVGKVFIFNYWIAYAGVEIDYAPGRECLFKHCIEFAACTVATLVRGKVDGKLYGMSIGFPAYKGSGIGVANNVAVAVRIFIEFNAYLLEKTFPYWIMRFLPD